MKKLKTILQSRYLFIIFLLVILCTYLRLNLFPYQSIYQDGELKTILKVKSIKYGDKKDTVIFSGKEDLISYYEMFPYNVGDMVEVKGILAKIKNNTIPNSFDYAFYLRGKKIFYQLEVSDIKLFKSNNNYLNAIKTSLTKRLNNLPNKAYYYAFILGNTSYFNEDMRLVYEKNGLVYLLSIGSLQVMFLVKIFEYVTKRLTKKKSLILITILLIIYCWLTNYTIGVLRCVLCYLIKRYSKFFKFKISYTNIIMLVGMLLLIIRPVYLLEMGFQYSFFISFGLSLWQRKLSKKKLIALYQIAILSFIFSFPITIYYHYEVNLLTMIISPIFMLIFNFLLFPLSLISFIFPNTIPVFNFMINFVEQINGYLNKIEIFQIVFCKLPFFIMILYALLIILIRFNKKYIYIFLFSIQVHYNLGMFLNEKAIFFLDVGQGDAIIIKNRNSIYLVDNGGTSSYEYSKEIINVVHSLGFKNINKMFLTHGDNDHLGSSIELIKKIRIDNVYFNNNAFNDNELKVIEELKKRNITYTKISNYALKSNGLLLKCISYNLGNENASSMIVFIQYNEFQALLMGDATLESESYLMKNFNFNNISVLKVGHHGSKTSTGKDFLDQIKPKYSIISVGKNNWYHHPHQEVLNNLQNTKIFRTDYDGSILFTVRNNKLRIKTWSP